MSHIVHPPDGRTMQCMEIRGGSRAVAAALATPGLDVWVYSTPYEGAEDGGDIYYLSLCGGGVITRLLVADVSGHGANVAEFSGMLRALMRKNINNKSQTSFVRALNRQFEESAQARHFATAVVATYLATRKRLTVCNAGHPRPIWYRAASRRWELMDRELGEAGNLPLGLDNETAYAQFAVTLGRDDIVLVYTDALIEAADPEGRMLGEDGLLGLASALDPHEPEGIGSTLLDGVASHRGGRPAEDDTTLVVLRHNAGGPRRMSVGEKLDVYAKFFGFKDY